MNVLREINVWYLSSGVLPENVRRGRTLWFRSLRFLNHPRLSINFSHFHSLFPPFSHSRLTIAVADLVMCPFFPVCSWQILYFLLSVNPIQFVSRSVLQMDNFCPLSNPFQWMHQCAFYRIHPAKLLRKVAALTLYLCNLNVIAPVHISCYVL